MGQKPRFSGGFGFFWGAGLGAALGASGRGWCDIGADKVLGGRLWRGFGRGGCGIGWSHMPRD